MKLALVSREGAILDAYRHFFEEQGIDLIHLKSISDLFQQPPDNLVSGFIVDIQSAMKATEAEKKWIRRMEGVFPNARTNWNPEKGVQALYSDMNVSDSDSLSAFLEDCRKFTPRPLRRHERKDINFPVHFWSIDLSEETAERAFTLNISYDGLFVCTCNVPPVDSLVWIRMPDINGQPIKVLVKMVRTWGDGMHIPGFGGTYVALEPSAAEKLDAFLKQE